MKIEHFNEGKRIASLDGMRAVAVGVVLLAHTLGTEHFFPRKPVYGVVGDLGPLGVRIFFIISGFLITTILLHEIKERGTLSLRRFYIRRVFRIFPAFYCFLGIMYLLNLWGVLAVPCADYVSAATYSINYRAQRSWYLTHCWSLAVEEQFYLIWPLVLWCLGRQKALLVALIAVFVVPMIRVITAVAFPGHRYGIPWEFQTVCDALATGCLLAGFRDSRGAAQSYSRIRTPLFAGLAAIAIILINCFSYHSVIVRILIGPTMMNLLLAWFLDIAMTHANSPLGRFLNWRPIIFAGVLSYSLYLWQQPFLTKSHQMFQAFPLNVALAIAGACLSYNLIELPFLRLRRRVESQRQPFCGEQAYAATETPQIETP